MTLEKYNNQPEKAVNSTKDQSSENTIESIVELFNNGPCLASKRERIGERYNEFLEEAKSFLEAIAENFSAEDQSAICSALTLMFSLHIEQKDRPDGSLYVSHPLKVARKTLEMSSRADKDLIIAALLHDSIEDQSDKLSLLSNDKNEQLNNKQKAVSAIKEKYGEKSGEIVYGLSNPDFDSMLRETGIHKNDPNYQIQKNILYAEHVAKSIENPDMLAIKLCDFSENALRLSGLPAETRDQQIKKEKLTAKYLPVMEIFIERLRKDNLYPEYQERLERELRLLRN